MKVNEYKVLRTAFEQAFPFMLNRLSDAGATMPEGVDAAMAEDQCWCEFSLMLDEMGVELEGGVE